jgi:hydrogenase maturation protease
MNVESPAQVVVIGVGNDYRHDDGLGPAVLARLRDLDLAGARLAVTDGDPSRLIDLWTGADLAVVVDAAHAAPPRPGRVHRLTLAGAAGLDRAAASTHGLGLGDAVELARTLDRLPRQLVVYAVEPADVTLGVGLSPAVAAAVAPVAAAVAAEVAAAHGGAADVC